MAARRVPLSAVIGFWWHERGKGLAGLVVAVVFCGTLSVLVAVFGKSQPVLATVAGFQALTGGQELALVDTPTGRTSVRVPVTTNCQIGDHLRLTRKWTASGRNYSGGMGLCDRR